jgi:hypothetical protein
MGADLRVKRRDPAKVVCGLALALEIAACGPEPGLGTPTITSRAEASIVQPSASRRPATATPEVISFDTLPTGEYLVHCALDGSDESLFVIGADGVPRGILLRDACWAAISPSGRYLAITDPVENREGAIIIHDLMSVSRRPVALSEGCQAPSWSPDEEWIAAVCESVANIHALSVWGRQDVVLVDCMDTWNAICGAPEWSPDGRFIAYERYSPPYPPQGVYLLDVGCIGHPECDPKEEFLAMFHGAYDWSPNASQMAGWHLPMEGDPRFAIIDVRSRKILPLEAAEGLGPGSIAFSPSGDYLAVESFRSDNSAELWLMTLSGGDPVVLDVEPYGSDLFWIHVP